MKKKTIIFFILLIIPISVLTFFTKVGPGDEIINYQSLCKMYNGNTIYSDFNVIVTPLFFYVGNIFFKLLGENLIAFKIYNIVIFEFLFISCYLLQKKLKMSTQSSILGTLITFVTVMLYIKVGANYNVLAIAFYILGISLYKREKTTKNMIIQGAIMFLIFFTKQNIGIFYIMSVAIVNVLFADKPKENIIQNIIFTIKEVMVFLLILVVFAIPMILKGNFINFIDYAFMGMNEFTNKNFVLSAKTEMVCAIYLIVAFLIDIIFFIKEKEKKEILVFATFLNLTVLPIINMYHTSFAILLNLIMLVLIIDKIKVKSFYISIILFIIINSYGIFCGIETNKKAHIVNNKNSNYYGLYIEEDLEKQIGEIIDYINKEKNVIVISEKTPLIMVELKMNNGIYDLPYSGNFGKMGTKGVINKIGELDDKLILLEEENGGQIPYSLREYIILNKTYLKSLGKFRIYK